MRNPSDVLVRYGVIPETARFDPGEGGPYARGQCVVARTHRGTELGTVLETIPRDGSGDDPADRPCVVRVALAEDERQFREHQRECVTQFETWQRRIADWELELELIDLEWTLDRAKLVLYVLNDRGADCTKLAIYAAAEGLGTVEVQPVTADGLVRMESPGGGCGSGGCGSCES
ncbi:MAG: PSP1 C-terminal domain-containing protein [Planctomycetaceae bacterium]